MSKLPESIQQVGINAHLLSRQASYRSAGVHGYIHNLLQNLPAEDDLAYSVFVGQGQVQPRPGLTVRRSSWPTSRPVVRIAWEQLVFPWHKLNLLHSMAFVTPLFAPWPTVITFYDLSFVHYPQHFTPGRGGYLRIFGRLSAQRARRILAISESTRRDLVMQWGLPAAKIDIAYPGVGEQFQPLPAVEVEAFRQRQGLPEQFILHLGTLQPRKNLTRLIQAYGRLRDRGTQAKLALAGGKGWLYDQTLAEIERLNLQNDIILPGYVSAQELPLWYNAAAVLVYPTLYEGFGLPVVEAMACGTPAVGSNVSSVPEAGGQAALLVDPYDVPAMTAALHQVLADEELRQSMQEQGYIQAAKFSWRGTATATVQCYHRALGEAV